MFQPTEYSEFQQYQPQQCCKFQVLGQIKEYKKNLISQ